MAWGSGEESRAFTRFSKESMASKAQDSATWNPSLTMSSVVKCELQRVGLLVETWIVDLPFSSGRP